MTRKKMLWIAVLIPLVVSLLPTAVSASTSTIYIDPPVIWDPDMPIGTEFSIDICVDFVMNLWAYQAWVSFDPTVIQGVSYENGPFIGKDTVPHIHPVYFAAGEGFDNEAGELKLFGAFIYFEVNPPHNRYLADGGGILATVTFVKVGDGCSPIILGPDTKLANKYADEIPSTLEHGAFSNTEGPELYIRRRGAHGASGVWPEWAAGVPCMTQTLYCRVLNYGFVGAWVEVEIVVRGPEGIVIYMTEQVWLGPAPEKGVPTEVTLSVSFHISTVGKYYIYGILYFKAGCMTAKAPYYHVEDTLGGEGISRDVAVGFNVKENI